MGKILVRCRNSELSVDDLRTWQGVVLGRAVSTLRSVETQQKVRPVGGFHVRNRDGYASVRNRRFIDLEPAIVTGFVTVAR
jgi:hypothetical protein